MNSSYASMLKRIFGLRRTGRKEHQGRQQGDRKPLPTGLFDILDHVKRHVGNSRDVLIRPIKITVRDRTAQAAILYLDGMANAKAVIDSLLVDGVETGMFDRASSREELMDIIKDSVLRAGDIRDIGDYKSLLHAIMSGDTVVLLDGLNKGVAASTRDWKDRGVVEPSTQTVIRGPREGFTETLRTNTMLIRRKIKDPRLWMEMKQIGKLTQTDVAMMYMKGIANENVVGEVRKRLDRIDIDGILESGYIEELIQDETFTLFPTLFNTERPDAVAAGLLEGRVAIVVDGTPFALLAPALFTHFLQTPEDYYQRADISTLLRLLRYLCLFIALLAPAAYVAVTTFHQEMIPTPLLVGLASQREGIPFPAFVEAVLMELTFEILREAGVRMPRMIGQAVSIVGALVIGQASVDAGLVSPAMVIIVSITAIATFVIPSFSMGISMRIIRFMLMLLAASFGLFGILVGLIAMVLHLCSLRSFGVPYMAPFAPIIMEDQKDNIIRMPIWAQSSRPRLISQNNVDRENNPPTPKADKQDG